MKKQQEDTLGMVLNVMIAILGPIAIYGIYWMATFKWWL